MKTNSVNIIQLENLSIGYSKPLISNIDTKIKKGDILLLIGKNGSGKTSFLKTLFKEISPLKGIIKILDKDITKISVSELSKLISVVLSKSQLSPDLKVYDLVSLGRYPYKKWYQKLTKEEDKKIEEVLNLFELYQYKNYYVNELSDGNLQKAMIARALVQDTPILIMDEPTSHLDVSNKLEVMNIIHYLAKEKEKTILFTSHDLSLGLNVADKLWMIKNKSLKIGFTEDLAKQEDILNYFAGKSLNFNYIINEYEFTPHINKKEVSIEGKIESIYWLRKALIRNSFSIHENAQITIIGKDSFFIVQSNETEYTFISIEEVINFLNNIKL